MKKTELYRRIEVTSVPYQPSKVLVGPVTCYENDVKTQIRIQRARILQELALEVMGGAYDNVSRLSIAVETNDLVHPETPSPATYKEGRLKKAREQLWELRDAFKKEPSAQLENKVHAQEVLVQALEVIDYA